MITSRQSSNDMIVYKYHVLNQYIIYKSTIYYNSAYKLPKKRFKITVN